MPHLFVLHQSVLFNTSVLSQVLLSQMASSSLSEILLKHPRTRTLTHNAYQPWECSTQWTLQPFNNTRTRKPQLGCLENLQY
ncbi:hypothetical protein BJ138DRAFT_1168341 [Hygrophoropsis aurantiaca]|uniref:Uncharacterized protein n=1 Tax=Hygrophoropsis aurantiaca TaxID=72124 RepID=A0ACB7ZQD9_9AGAM|nr:hypothetical protein BJ138DRAFT_1168341 [Hygrophoropsis aurantiaca]